MVCEKQDAAMRVAEALSSGAPEAFTVGGVVAFRLSDGMGRRFVVCAAAGHLYGLADTATDRRVYPAADLEWFPLGAKDKASRQVASRIRAIEALSKDAVAFVNACDFDVEGETIGHNILRYACHAREEDSWRARFSSLVKQDVVEAFAEGRLSRPDGLAKAGRMRHVVDFLWGVNMSRALSESMRTARGFRTLSIGRVQGPTLRFVVDKEVEVRSFVPIPYWSVKGVFDIDGATFDAGYSSEPPTKRRAEEVVSECASREGAVSRVTERSFARERPPPMNLADLQREAYRRFGYPPSRTLQIAERLYLAALISYPRTGSQRLPKTDHRTIISKIVGMPEYSRLAKEVSSGDLRPSEGPGIDHAHPAIYPTGETPGRPLGPEERRLLDIVVRRYLACFAKAAVLQSRSVVIALGEHEFVAETTRTLVAGWMGLTGESREADGRKALPEVHEGDLAVSKRIDVEEHLRAPPWRYNQATLLEKMEREGIGTKATRAGIISTLLARGYVSGASLVPSDLGFSVIEVMREHCPQIVSAQLTRDTEAGLEAMETSPESGLEFYEGILTLLLKQLGEVRSHEHEIAGRMSGSAEPRRDTLGRCPVCKEGELWVVRSRRSGKRFVGCTNYSRGCRASAPLPQRGGLRHAGTCKTCGWPAVYVSGWRRKRLCVNEKCPRKVNVYRMQDLQAKSGRGPSRA